MFSLSESLDFREKGACGCGGDNQEFLEYMHMIKDECHFRFKRKIKFALKVPHIKNEIGWDR